LPDGSVAHPLERIRLAVAKPRGARFYAFLAAGVLALIVITVSLMFAANAHRERTDNAYVRADISVLSAEVQGYVRAVRVTDNQTVKAGDPLVEIDPSDYSAGVERARANLEKAQAQLDADLAEQKRAGADYGRYQPLARSGLVSASGIAALRADAQRTSAAAEASRANVAAAKADLQTAQTGLSRTIVRAPIDGVIGNRVVQPGQLVRPGVQLLSVVPLTDVYVVANFKETQLHDMRAGQPVTVKVDAYPDLKLDGVVDSLAPASGSQFSILPQDTATGNFTKITQRVPVKTKLKLTPEAAGLLRPGLSVVAVVDTKQKT
jgi:membrane fusion protein (multidrug efflux system)